MADRDRLETAGLNEFGLPRHGDGVGPTLRPDIIAERHSHDWDAPVTDPVAPEAVEPSGICARAIAEDLVHRGRAASLAPAGLDLLDTAEPGVPLGDNELQGARLAHALAQDG